MKKIYIASVIVCFLFLGCSKSPVPDEEEISKSPEFTKQEEWPFLQKGWKLYQLNSRVIHNAAVRHYCVLQGNIRKDLRRDGIKFPLNAIIDGDTFREKVTSFEDVERYLNKFLQYSSYTSSRWAPVGSIEDVKKKLATSLNHENEEKQIEDIINTNKDVLKNRIIPEKWTEDKKEYTKKCAIAFFGETRESPSHLTFYIFERTFHVDKVSGHVRVEEENIIKHHIQKRKI